MKLPRPGPDIGEPQQPHMVLAMLILLNMADENERPALAEALSSAVRKMWDWDAKRFSDELAECNKVMIVAGSRFTCWFTQASFEFDVNVPQ